MILPTGRTCFYGGGIWVGEPGVCRSFQEQPCVTVPAQRGLSTYGGLLESILTSPRDAVFWGAQSTPEKMGDWAEDSPGLGEVLLSIPREISVLAGLLEMPAPEPVPSGEVCYVGSWYGCHEARLHPCLCFAMVLSPAKSQHTGQPLGLEAPLEEEHLCQLLIILMG